MKRSNIADLQDGAEPGSKFSSPGEPSFVSTYSRFSQLYCPSHGDRDQMRPRPGPQNLDSLGRRRSKRAGSDPFAPQIHNLTRKFPFFWVNLNSFPYPRASESISMDTDLDQYADRSKSVSLLLISLILSPPSGNTRYYRNILHTS